MRIRRFITALVLLTLLTTACLSAVSENRDILQGLCGKGSGFSCTTNAQSQGDRLNPGQALIFRGTAATTGYLTILSFSSQGQLVRLFPNTFDAGGRIEGGKPFTVPADDRYSFQMGNVQETDLVKVFFTPQPLDVFLVTEWKKAGHFFLAMKPATALATLRTSFARQADQAVALTFTVETRSGSATPTHTASAPTSSGMNVSPTVSVTWLASPGMDISSRTVLASTTPSDLETDLEEDRIPPDMFAVLSQPEPPKPAFEPPDVDLSITATPSRLPLDEFAGFNPDKPCERSTWSMKGTPWRVDQKDLEMLSGEDEEAANPEPAYQSFTFDLSVYTKMVQAAMESIRLIYGGFSSKEEKVFGQLWTPFFDAPNAAAFEYFQKLTPLLQQYLEASAAIAALEQARLSAWKEGFLNAGLSDPQGSQVSLQIICGITAQIVQAKDQLLELVQQIQKLGDPPNPLAAKCQARKRHSPPAPPVQTVKVSWETWKPDFSFNEKPDECALMFSIDRTSLGVLPGRAEHYKINRYWKTPDASQARYDPTMEPTRWIADRWGGARETVTHAYLDVAARDLLNVDYSRKKPDGLLRQSPGWLGFGVSFLPPRTSFDAPRIARWISAINGPLDHQTGVMEVGKEPFEMKAGDLLRPDGRVRNANFVYLIDLGKDRPMAMVMGYCFTWNGLQSDPGKSRHARLMLEDFLKHLKFEFVPAVPPEEKDLAHNSPEIDWDAWKEKMAVKQEEYEKLVAQLKQAQSQAAEAKASQEAINSSISDSRAIIAHYEMLAERVQAELNALPPGDGRRKKLENELAMYRNDVENEQYYIQTLETGTAHYQRFSYQDHLMREMQARMQLELNEMSLRTRLFLTLPKFFRQVDDARDPELWKKRRAELETALTAPDSLQRLQSLSLVLRDQLRGQGQKAMDTEAGMARTEDWKLFGVEAVVKTAEVTLMIGSLAIPGAANVMLGYGIAQGGLVEGSVVKAFENGVRAYSDKVDVAWAGVQGFFELEETRDASGRIVQRPRGFAGAIEKAGLTFLQNKAMEFAGGFLQSRLAGQAGAGDTPSGNTRPADPNRPQPDVAHPDPAIAKDPHARAGEKTVYKTNEAKHREASQAIDAGFQKQVPRKADGSIDTAHPDYARVKAAHDQRLGDLKRNYEVILKRDRLHQELDQCTQDFGKQVAEASDIPHDTDGAPDVGSEAYQKLRQQWQAQMDAIRSRGEFKDTRMPVVEQALGQSGMTVKDHFSGGSPKNINSDIDVTPQSQKQMNDFLASLAAQGHRPAPDSPPDRYVFPGLDMVVWKLESPTSLLKKLGGKDVFTKEDFALLKKLYSTDGAQRGSVEWSFYAGSDKFGTIGGVSHTTNLGPKDPLGAVLDNSKKFVDALNTPGGVDFHVLGKSLHKAIGVVNTLPGRKNTPEVALLLKKAEMLRKHRTPAEAGIVTPGASAKQQKQEMDNFLDAARRQMKESMDVGRQASDRLSASRRLQQAAAMKSGNKDLAENLRITQALITTTNEAGIRVLSGRDPALLDVLLPPPPRVFPDGATAPGSPDARKPTTNGWGWFLNEITQTPAPRSTPLTPPLQKTADRFRKIADALEKSKNAGLKPESREYQHLENLKKAASAGATDPIAGLRQARMISGFSSGQVLEELEQRFGIPPQPQTQGNERQP